MFVINYLYFISDLTTNISNIQLELGSTATDYEPYKSNTLAPETVLRSLPNGTQDILYNAVVDSTDSTKYLPTDGWVHGLKLGSQVIYCSGGLLCLSACALA